MPNENDNKNSFKFMAYQTKRNGTKCESNGQREKQQQQRLLGHFIIVQLALRPHTHTHTESHTLAAGSKANGICHLALTSAWGRQRAARETYSCQGRHIQSHWLCTINGGQLDTPTPPLPPTRRDLSNYCAIVCENLCQVSVSPLNLT